MNLEILKQQVVAKVGASEDEARLQDVLDILSDEHLNENEIYYRIRLEESIWQADVGKIVSAESVHQMARQWLTK